MNTLSTVEIIGYSASVFIILSFLMKDVRRIRAVNLLGCICFVIYGLLAELWPVVIPNAILSIVQVYHLLADRSQGHKR